jgi:Domain of unknown function (DUF4440)
VFEQMVNFKGGKYASHKTDDDWNLRFGNAAGAGNGIRPGRSSGNSESARERVARLVCERREGAGAAGADEAKWKNQADIMRTAAEFQADGGKLLRLEFPRTEIQRFGDVAIIWTSYLVETEENGKREVVSGRATEIFVKRNGEWVNPGWHTDSFK